MAWTDVYRTSDVLAEWQALEAAGRHDALELEAYWLHRRRWHKPGMAVDVAELERWMEAYRQRRAAVCAAESAEVDDAVVGRP